MSSSNVNLDLIQPSQANKEITANELFLSGSPSTAFARRRSTTSGLIWGYYGTEYKTSLGTFVTVANGTLTLTPSTTCYVQVERETGTVSFNTTGFTSSTHQELYSIVTNSTGVVSYKDVRQIVGQGKDGEPGAPGAPGVNGIGSIDGVIGATFDAGNGVLANGAFCDVYVPYNLEVNEWVITCFPSGSLTVNVWVDDVANYPPTSLDSITGGANPSVSSNLIASSSSLGSWDTEISAGSMVRFQLSSVSTCQRATITLKITKQAAP